MTTSALMLYDWPVALVPMLATTGMAYGERSSSTRVSIVLDLPHETEVHGAAGRIHMDRRLRLDQVTVFSRQADGRAPVRG